MKLILSLILGGLLMATYNDDLCFFRLPDGTAVCRPCSSPPPDSSFVDKAPDGTPIDNIELKDIGPIEEEGNH